MVGAKESDVTERMIHTSGEQIQGNQTCKDRDGVENWRKGGGGGGLGKLDTTSSLCLDRETR